MMLSFVYTTLFLYKLQIVTRPKPVKSEAQVFIHLLFCCIEFTF